MVLLHHARRGFDLDNLFQNNPQILSWVYFKAFNVLHIDLTWVYYGLQEVIYKIKGVLGVQIFFVISGFLITRFFLNKTIDLKLIRYFYLRRFLRVYPAYIAMILVGLIYLSLNIKISFSEFMLSFLKYAFFLQNYFPRNFLFEHTWTMVVFEQFYLFVPFIIYGVFKIFKSAKMRWMALFSLFILAKFLGPVIRSSYLLNGEAVINWPLKAPAPYFTTLYHIGSLGVGGILALLEVHANKFKKSKWIGLPFWIVGVVLYWFLYFHFDWNYNHGSWCLYTLGSMACACLMIAAYQGVSFITNFKWMQLIGRHSYGIYLWHILIFLFWVKFIDIIPVSALVVIYFLSAFAVGVISTKTIEYYFLKLFKG